MQIHRKYKQARQDDKNKKWWERRKVCREDVAEDKEDQWDCGLSGMLWAWDNTKVIPTPWAQAGSCALVGSLQMCMLSPPWS